MKYKVTLLWRGLCVAYILNIYDAEFSRPKKEKKVGEGSTMIPVFPHVDMDTPDLASRELNYNDVPALRYVIPRTCTLITYLCV